MNLKPQETLLEECFDHNEKVLTAISGELVFVQKAVCTAPLEDDETFGRAEENNKDSRLNASHYISLAMATFNIHHLIRFNGHTVRDGNDKMWIS